MGTPFSRWRRAAQDFQPVEAGQRQVEDDQVVMFGMQRVIGVIAAVEDVEHVTGVAQRLADPLGEFGVIFDQEQTHG